MRSIVFGFCSKITEVLPTTLFPASAPTERKKNKKTRNPFLGLGLELFVMTFAGFDDDGIFGQLVDEAVLLINASAVIPAKVL